MEIGRANPTIWPHLIPGNVLCCYCPSFATVHLWKDSWTNWIFGKEMDIKCCQRCFDELRLIGKENFAVNVSTFVMGGLMGLLFVAFSTSS